MRVSVSGKIFFRGGFLAVGWGMKKPYLENLGRRFGRLVAVEYVGVKSNSSVWRFRCHHGSERWTHLLCLDAVTTTATSIEFRCQ
jgi:hypothetical protein